jgi:hypothetical protein
MHSCSSTRGAEPAGAADVSDHYVVVVCIVERIPWMRNPKPCPRAYKHSLLPLTYCRMLHLAKRTMSDAVTVAPGMTSKDFIDGTFKAAGLVLTAGTLFVVANQWMTQLRIEAVETTLAAKIDAVETNLRAEIRTLDSRVGGLERNMETALEMLRIMSGTNAGDRSASLPPGANK